MSRTGAKRIEDIPDSILASINEGKTETVTLVESLSLNLHILLARALPEISPQTRSIIKAHSDQTWLKKSKLVIELIFNELGPEAAKKLQKHNSDNVRGWAAGIIALDSTLSLEEKFLAIQPVADDPHFNTREMSWLFMRDIIIKDIQKSIKILEPWAFNKSPRLRRFAVEATRPRGVWCKHCSELKKTPSLGLNILEPLKNDTSRYVQNAVGNWLNDASKTTPQFTLAVTKRWGKESQSSDTEYIIKRATRNL